MNIVMQKSEKQNPGGCKCTSCTCLRAPLVVHDPFSQEKHLFTLLILSRTSDNTTSHLGGRMHGPSPTSNFGGTVPPVPLDFRPCLDITNIKTKRHENSV